ncbi:MAG: HD-GYP domain-containing protein [Candidatus Omnitrophica bacterium]|nr:HD-GYP domain-containing protein [Candidatus Omnitrophota bacterium]MBU2044620.1 HD-GYP domain-containing protein [Candidatus Omnitrophota bacterium]MBU2474051.1 HD-GYP domain-containing protein [Candidatus Omnitrophota bacterium]
MKKSKSTSSKKKPRHDYRRDLETAAKQMILIRRVDTLIKLILRSIIKNLKVEHAGLLLYEKSKDSYIVTVSRGKGGLKIPTGLTKITKDNTLVKYFTDKQLRIFGEGPLILGKLSSYLNSRTTRASKELRIFLQDLAFQFSLYNAKACIPGFFREELIFILFLGQKVNRKPLNQEELGFLSVLSSDAVMAIQNAWYFQDLDKQLNRNKNLFLQTVMALATAIEAKDKYTSGHTERVSYYSLLLADELRRTNNDLQKDWDKFIQDLKIASLLHDIGKIGLREGVLNKPGFLTDEERSEMQKHPLVGSSILNQVDEFNQPILGVKYHHERYDGEGYPEKLKGEKIPLIAQVIAVADTYDAMVSDRPYRKGMPKDQVIQEIRKNRGRQFSPVTVDAFLSLCKQGKI